MLTIEQRLSNLENAFFAFQKRVESEKYYTDADINGTRQGIANITPYTETKTAYYGETEKVFYNSPNGIVSVYFSNYNGNYNVSRVADRVTISFDALKADTDITISIM